MDPMIQKYVGSLIRTLLAGVVPFLVSIGMTEDDTQQFVTLLAGALAALGWSFWEKRGSRQKLLTAQALPTTATETEVVAKVAAGQAPPVSTPANVVPKLTSV